MRYVSFFCGLNATACILLFLLLLPEGAEAGFRVTLGEQEKRIYGMEAGLRAQEGAGDVLQIQVSQINVIQTENSKDVVVMLKAAVEEVRRSGQGRKIGDVIYVRYRTRDGTGYEDESDLMIPKEGARLNAFLDYIGAENHYVPAAGAFSFRSPEEVGIRHRNQGGAKAKTRPKTPEPVALEKSVGPMVPSVDTDEAYWNAPVGE